jgi:hypothetical protein
MTDEVVPATGAVTEEPDDDEAEGQAILAIMKALKSLAPETRRRVTGWAVTKYGATTSIEHPLEKDDGAKSVGARRIPRSVAAMLLTLSPTTTSQPCSTQRSRGPRWSERQSPASGSRPG